MLLYALVLALILSLQSIEKPRADDEVHDGLARAASLYYDARYKESIELLLRIDNALRSKIGQLKEKIDVHLHLALAHIGLNEMMEALASFRDLYALDADFQLDPDQFPPKVLTLAEQARKKAVQVRCDVLRNDARKQLESQNATAVLNLIRPMESKCGGLEEIAALSADLLYKRGVELYKRGELSEALEDFRNAVKLSPKHELAAQYVDLTESKLQMSTDLLLLEWRRNFDAHDVARASAAYRQMTAYEGRTGGVKQVLEQVRSDYRKTLSDLLESWRRACANGDALAMDNIAREAAELLPDPSIGQDILEQMAGCSRPRCIQMNAQLALTRLKTRVNPDIPAAALDFVRNNPPAVRVKARVDEQGNVSVTDTEGGGNELVHHAVRNAVERWKFSPIIDETGSRCVETEFPIVIRP